MKDCDLSTTLRNEQQGCSSGSSFTAIAKVPTPARSVALATPITMREDVAYSRRVLVQQTCRFLYASAAGAVAPSELEALAGAIRYAATTSVDSTIAKQTNPLDSVGHSWKVVHRPSVNVRAQPSRKAQVLDRKKLGSIVYGVEVNGWVQLEGELGFMIISNEGQGILLKRSDEVQDMQPIKDKGQSLPLLECPWREHLAQFVSTRDLAMVSSISSAAREELTVDPEDESDDDESRRRLRVPLVELKLESAEAELDRVSLPHTRILRIWSRLSLEAVVAAVRRGGPSSIRSLERLVITGCPLHPPDVKSLLGFAVSANRFTALNLEKNQLQDAVIQALAAALDADAAPNLESINIRFNRVGDAGVVALAQSRGVARLKWINLKMNSITDCGASAFANMLKDNRCMTLINLRRQCPGLTDKTAFAFAETLRSRSVLEQVRLRRNKISGTGAVALSEAIAARFGDCLVPPARRLELDLEGNRVNDAGALALMKAVAVVPKQIRLEVLLCGNDASQTSVDTTAKKVGDSVVASDTRVTFDSKSETAL
eukprot:TRINITY_DN57029_c0_g1_i1.p1 TRINITY_DN57029_c0_g1~~TRINITY_DN57029_c0_g1_i1.p1  ORF type:complete len:544 (-),score=96.76 TRINITY_DN57029_c0_g1_i1:280-1911(-)